MLTNATYFPAEGRTIHSFYFLQCRSSFWKNISYPENHKSKALWMKDSIPAQQ
jgi:hypothetical protein